MIREITDKNVWESFLFQCKEKTFLQSWNWGEFQSKQGNKIWRFSIEENSEIIVVFLVILIKARRGTFLFVPHGPMSTRCAPGAHKVELEKLKELANKEKADFIRIAPILERNEENNKIFKDLGFKKAPIHMHPELTWELDLSNSEENLLSQMRKTTRYLIRQAEKNPDIKIRKSYDVKDIEIFNDIYKKTAERHNFIAFSLDYLEKEFEIFNKDGQAVIFLGEYKGKIVSSAVIIYWQDKAVYHQGASLADYSKIPVSYLLQWEAIKEAKRRNCLTYNFWGISENTEDKRHPWHGLSLFKMGFGGERKEYVRTQDFPLAKRYYFNYFIERIRKIKRRI